MKRIMRVLLVILFILLPIRVKALKTTSELISVKKMGVDVELGDMQLKNVSFVPYNNYQNSGQKGYTINASFYSLYKKNINVSIVFKLYDNFKNELKTYEDKFDLSYDRYVLYEKGEVYPSLDSVAYYSVKLEILTDVSTPKKSDVSTDYYIDELSSNIVITEDREIIYNEKLNVTFSNDSNYFYYYVPVKDIYLLKNIKVDDKYKIELEKGINNITVGSKDKKYKDEQVFNVSYKYILGKDYNKFDDVIKLDLINSFNDYVKKSNITIKVPKEKGIKEIIFYLDGDKIKQDYKIDGNIITLKYKKLKNNSVLGMKMVFENNYFTNRKSIVDNMIMGGLVLPITSFLVVLIVYMLIRNKKIMSKNINMDLISKYSSLEVGYLYNDKLDNKDIMSMLLSLANKGYLNIEKQKDGYLLTKVKEYEDNNEYEKALLEGIFGEKNSVKEEDLYYLDNSFINDIKNSIEQKYKAKFYNNYFNKYLVVVILAYLTVFLITYRPLVVFDHTYLLLGVSLSMLILTVVFIIVNSSFKLIERIIGYLSVTIFYTFLAYFVILPSLKVSILYMLIYIVGILSIIGSFVIYRMIPKRKMAANRLLRNINRLKHDIDKNVVVDKDKFLKLLPYTYVIDSYDNFTNRNVFNEVNWYIDNNFVYWNFVNEMKTLLANITYDLTHVDRNGVNK